LHAAIEVSQIADHSRDWIDLAAYRYLYDIVMAVAMGIAAFAIDGAILFLGIGIGVQAMRGAENIPSR